MNNATSIPPTEPAIPSGPYDSEHQALDAAEPIYAAARRDRVRGSMARANAAALRETLAAADVELGAFDQTIVMWVAGWEPQTVQAVIGWISRANGGAR